MRPRNPASTEPGEVHAHLTVSFVRLDTAASGVPYLAVWSECVAGDTFAQIAELVDRLARRLENALGADDVVPAADADVAAA